MEHLYKCDYCNHFNTKEKMLNHEEKCLHNLEKKACLSCRYYNGGFNCNGIK